MLISNEFEVPQPVDVVWEFFHDIPQVAKCLPGTELTEELGDDKFKGEVAIRMGPVKLMFAGNADILERDETAKSMIVDADGAEVNGRGQASMQMTAGVQPAARGSKVKVDLDLNLSGAAAQYGRGMVSDVTTVLLQQFAVNMQNRIDAIQRGVDPDSIGAVAPASGFAIAMQAAKMALTRVVRRFFMPYQPHAN